MPEKCGFVDCKNDAEYMLYAIGPRTPTMACGACKKIAEYVMQSIKAPLVTHRLHDANLSHND